MAGQDYRMAGPLMISRMNDWYTVVLRRMDQGGREGARRRGWGRDASVNY